MTSTSSNHRAVEGLLGLVGISLGLIPLIQYLVNGRPGLWRLVLGSAPGAEGWIVPAAVLAGCFLGLVAVDRRRHV
jgi:hypothetical protein